MTISPDGSTLAAGSTGNLVTSAGTWSYGAVKLLGGLNILLNGKPTAGYASLLTIANGGQIYAQNTQGWYVWGGQFWQTSGAPPAPVPPPSGVPGIKTIPGTAYTLTNSDNGNMLKYAGMTVGLLLKVPGGLVTPSTVEIMQVGDEAVTVVLGSGVTILSRLGYTKTAGRGAVIGLIGHAPNSYLLVGDGA